MSAPMVVAGVDGCPAGWLVVLRSLQAEATRALIFETFAEVLAMPDVPSVIAVDMPIGLPGRGAAGGRRCDVEARRGLGARQSSLFAVPARAAVMETDYARACTAARACSDPPRMVSKQCFNLFPKIREIDALMTPALQARVVECHPEAAFVAMNGGAALSEPKKVKSRAHPPGLEQRRGLLAAHGFARAFVDSRPFRPSQAGADDLIDACACAWTAARVWRGAAVRFPAVPDVDANGLRMEIWA